MFCGQPTKPVANRPHVCTYCGELIEKRTQYVRWASVDGRWFTNKMHPECYTDLLEVSGEDGDYGYTAYAGERPK